jgi:NTP pyrophosphatase (non-canonical NTP hydrolase)
MNQENYNKLAEKTMSTNFYVTEQKQINLLHAALGLMTESVELIENYDGSKEYDSVNVFEELGDITWYLSIIQRELGFQIDDSFFKKEDTMNELFKEYSTIYCVDLIKSVNNILDYHKKMAFYNKPMDSNKYRDYANQVAKSLKVIVVLEGFNISDIHERNIAKLKARYGEKFNEEGALNRDLDKERAILAN